LLFRKGGEVFGERTNLALTKKEPGTEEDHLTLGGGGVVRRRGIKNHVNGWGKR